MLGRKIQRTPAAEVGGLVSETLRRREAGLGVGVVAHGVITCEEFGGDLGV